MNRKSDEGAAKTPIIVKVGGSLYNHVPELVPVFLASGRPLFIVPGGGPFADAIRNTLIDGDAAHWMAVAAMDQYGWFIVSNGMDPSSRLQKPEQQVVFLPYCSIRQFDPLPHSWDITSDSIAAWIAAVLGLDLLILKSVDGILEHHVLQKEVTTPVKTDIVDPHFIPYVLKNKIKTTIINGSHADRVEKCLRGYVVPCTRIGTTF